MILNTCLRRFEQFQKQQGRSQVLQSAKDLYSADLRNLLRKLKRACPEAYTQHMAQVEAAYDSWNTLNTKEGIPVDNEGPDSSELVLAGQKIEDSVFAFFDRESLLKLRPHLRGHTRLQMVLCNLHLPLNSFQELATARLVVRPHRSRYLDRRKQAWVLIRLLPSSLSILTSLAILASRRAKLSPS